MTLDSTQPLPAVSASRPAGRPRLRLPERVLDQIEAGVHARAEVAGGLLIGYPHGDGYWVERILPVRNVADAELRRIAFIVEQRALANVRTTLAGTPFSVLGLYYGGGSLHPGDRGHEGELGSDPDVLWLIPTSNGSGRTAPRAWRRGDREAELELEVELVPTTPVPTAFCPE